MSSDMLEICVKRVQKKLICTNPEWKAEGASHLTISIKQKVGGAPSGRSPSHPLSIHFLSLTDFQQDFES